LTQIQNKLDQIGVAFGVPSTADSSTASQTNSATERTK